MDALSVSYQDERPDLELSDLTALVIRALCHCAISAINAISAISKETPPCWDFKTAQIKEAAIEIAKDEDGDIEYVNNSRRIGRVLGSMRLGKVPRPGGKGSRTWRVTLNDLGRWTTTYGLKLPDELQSTPHFTNGTNGINGTNGTDTPLPDIGTISTIGTLAQPEEREVFTI